jgi:hypothetical protein
MNSDQYFDRARRPEFGDDPKSVVSLVQVMIWYQNMPNSRVGLLYDLVDHVKAGGNRPRLL